MPARPCLEPGCPVLIQDAPGKRRRPRCPGHQRAADAQQTRNKRVRRPYTAAEQKRRTAAVAEHVDEYGWVCLGTPWCDVPNQPHPTRDLTADHIIPPGAGGPESGPLRAICRTANSRRGDRLTVRTG